MAERKSLAEARESIDDIFRTLEDRLGLEMVVKLTPELNAAKSAVFAEVLDQANFDQLYNFANAPLELVRRAGAEQSLRDFERAVGAYKVQAEVTRRVDQWKETRSQGRGGAGTAAVTEAGIAEAVDQDVKTWKAIRSQGAEKDGLAPGRKDPTREANER